MAWVKIPAENHPLFLAALPTDKRVTTLKMFGATAAKVNGQLFGGLFGRGMMVKVSPADQKRALALDGAEPFDPMGKGRPMGDSVLLPESILDEPAAMKAWLARALAYTLTLPPKPAKKPTPRSPARSKRTDGPGSRARSAPRSRARR